VRDALSAFDAELDPVKKKALRNQKRNYLESISTVESRRLGGLHPMHQRGAHAGLSKLECRMCVNDGSYRYHHQRHVEAFVKSRESKAL
jgi:hypothetical protein